MDKKYIRFIDSSYNALFHVANGDSVRVKFEDGDVREYVCKYIDETHAFIGVNVFHICEFAEQMERFGRIYEPVHEIGDLGFYQKRYYDRDNIGKDGKPVPYYSLVQFCFNRQTHEQTDINYAFCLEPSTAGKTFCKVTLYPNKTIEEGIPNISFSSDITELCGDDVLCARINNIVKAIKEEQHCVVPTLNDVISLAEKEKQACVPIDNKSMPVDEIELV